ncbi:MAG TPA: sulfotransferase [Arenibaculum sp.]|nr:sulfotransferase [Arenibaculum sp.]
MTAQYSWLDRFLHRVAFAQIEMQQGLSSLEDRMFAGRIPDTAPERPVFVTSLPRAGTTLLLETLSGLGDFATHTYRDMPFVLCPMLWNRMSAGFRKTQDLRERAHGDGMAVGYDSPEAFEEVAWMAFWEDKYLPDRIIPWTAADRNSEFETFLNAHMRKIVALRADARGDAESCEDGGTLRYLSKNNANVARLELLPALFPDCRILVPVRAPWGHVRSLHHQHARFLDLHGTDGFGRSYMAWLGHFEFGATLKPIDFGGWLDRSGPLDPLRDEFWIAYWTNAYEAVLAAAGPNVRFIDYDCLCAEPRSMLEALAEAADLKDPAPLLARADRFRPPTAYAPPDGAPVTLRRATELHAALTARSIG